MKALCERDGEKALRERGPVGETPLHLMLLYGGASSMERSAQLRSAKYVGEKFPKTVNDVYVGDEYFGESALHIAIVNKNVELVRWLLATSVNVKGLLAARATGRFFSRGAPCYYGEYALSFAASTGQGDLVEILLAAGADATAQDTHGNTCLHMAVIHNQPDMFTLICEKWERGKNEANGSSLERLSNADGLSPMLFAARSGFKDMFEFLLNRTCITEWAYGPVTCQRMPLLDVDTRQRKGTGALAEIVANGHLDLLSIPLIQELLQRKWDFYIGRLFYERVWHTLAFLITMTLVHVTSYADSGSDDTLSARSTNGEDRNFRRRHRPTRGRVPPSQAHERAKRGFGDVLRDVPGFVRLSRDFPRRAPRGCDAGGVIFVRLVLLRVAFHGVQEHRALRDHDL